MHMIATFAMLTSILRLQSLVLANLFVWMEGLFAVGYRPALQAALHDRVSKHLAALHSQKEALLKPSADPRQQQPS